MATALTYNVPVHSGPGWFALPARLGTRFYLYVEPTSDVGDAVESLISEPLREFWTVEWSHIDPFGWDVYVVQRELPPADPQITA